MLLTLLSKMNLRKKSQIKKKLWNKQKIIFHMTQKQEMIIKDKTKQELNADQTSLLYIM